MPHIHFTFGLKNWFTFSFELGVQLQFDTQPFATDQISRIDTFKSGDEANEELPGGSNSSTALLKSGDEADTEHAGDQMWDLLSPDSSDAPSTKSPTLIESTISNQPSCPLFNKLPSEIRIMIYKELLTSNNVIRNAHKLLGPNLSFLCSDNVRLRDIDSRILRTCKKIHDEARLILYQENCFGFRTIDAMKSFAHDEMPDRFSALKDQSQESRWRRYGRLTHVRIVVLKLEHDSDYVVTGSRKDLMRYWSEFFVNPRSWHPVKFPSLEKLHLDFSKWSLTPAEQDSLTVSPFIKTLGRSEGLQQLTLKGITHTQNLQDLKDGLVKHGGRFRVRDSQDRLIVDVVVSKEEQEPV